jgi:hypothetical protein
MADILYDPGKVAGMNVGIINAIGAMKLFDDDGAAITNSVTGLTTANFSVDAITGVLSNATEIDFTVVTADINTIVTYVVLQNAEQTLNLVKIDLKDSVGTLQPITITTAGTVTFAIGALTADL